MAKAVDDAGLCVLEGKGAFGNCALVQYRGAVRPLLRNGISRYRTGFEMSRLRCMGRENNPAVLPVHDVVKALIKLVEGAQGSGRGL